MTDGDAVTILSYISELIDEEGNKSAPLFLMDRAKNLSNGKRAPLE